MSIEPEDNASRLAPLADEYEPTEADAERVLAKLQAALVAPPAPSAPSSPPATAGAAAGVHGGKKALVVGLSCLTFAVAGGAVFELTRNPTPSTTSAPAITTVVTTAPSAPEPPRAAEATAEIPSVSVDALPSAVAGTLKTGSEPKSAPANVAPARPATTDTLEKETRLLAAARRALASGDGERALALLDEHAREFPDGWLANDRTAERIVVLCSVGRKADAVREGRVFLEGRPKSPLTLRVESSCAGER